MCSGTHSTDCSQAQNACWLVPLPSPPLSLSLTRYFCLHVLPACVSLAIIHWKGQGGRQGDARDDSRRRDESSVLRMEKTVTSSLDHIHAVLVCCVVCGSRLCAFIVFFICLFFSYCMWSPFFVNIQRCGTFFVRWSPCIIILCTLSFEYSTISHSSHVICGGHCV